MDVQVKVGSLIRTIAEQEISDIVGKIVAQLEVTHRGHSTFVREEEFPRKFGKLL